MKNELYLSSCLLVSFIFQLTVKIEVREMLKSRESGVFACRLSVRVGVYISVCMDEKRTCAFAVVAVRLEARLASG